MSESAHPARTARPVTAVHDAASPERPRSRAGAGAHPLLGLQQSHGNAAIGALLRAGLARAKLRVGRSNDPEEAAADRAADEFARSSGSSSPCSCGGTCDECASETRGRTLRRSTTAGVPAFGVEIDGRREAAVRDLGPGRELPREVRAPFEAHFGC